MHALTSAAAKAVLAGGLPAPAAENLVNAWAYARSLAAEIEGQIRENESA